MRNKVKEAFVDTDVIIRLLTADDLKKQEAAASLFEKVERGERVLKATDITIADCVFILSSQKLYHLPRINIRNILTTLLRLSHFKVENKQALLSALDLYAVTNIDFSDAFVASSVKQSKTKTVYSYDHDYDKIAGVIREEP